jgi:putative CocE/NonD family hydrolase
MPVDGPDGLLLREEAMAQRAALYRWRSAEAMARAFQNGEFATHWVDRMRSLGVPDDPVLGRPRLATEQIEEINAAGVPAYIVGGWWDLNFSTTTISLYRALEVPKKLTVGPWTHSQYAFPLEPVRWFDYWLRGIDNGVLTEPAVHYAVTERNGRVRWRQVEDFPPPETAMRVFHLASALPESRSQLQDAPSPSASLRLVFDPKATTGRGNRTNYLFEKATLWYSGLGDREGVGLRFDSAPLAEDIEISGAPFLSLLVASDQPVGALFAILEQIAPDGRASYITEGLLNLEYRALRATWPTYIGQAPLGQFPQDAIPITPGEPMSIGLDLLAVCRVVPKADRLRLTLTSADAGNWWTPPTDPPFTLTLARGGPHHATLSLPITHDSARAPFVTGLFLDDALEYAFEPSTWVDDGPRSPPVAPDRAQP